jgi:DNA-binding NarL/FixJ family response regulator
MTNGTLLVSRADRLLLHRKSRLEALGFTKVEVTGEEKDSLNRVIGELNPRLVLINSAFYQAATPFMTGQLLKSYPDLNIAAVSMSEYPDDLAVWFIWHGAKSYVNLWEGYEEFHYGLKEVREGKQYIAPRVRELLDGFSEWPKTGAGTTKRQMEILILLCNGQSAQEIGDKLHISKRTVEWHFDELYQLFHVRNKEELMKTVFCLDLVTKRDLCFHREWKPRALPQWASIKQKNSGRGLKAW